MKKQNYVTPSVEVLKIEIEGSILALSAESGGIIDGGGF